MPRTSTRSPSSCIEVLDTIFHINPSDCDNTFNWPSYNDTIQFRLNKGWIIAELIGSSTGFILPHNSEIVSPICRVFASPGAQVFLDVSHCVKLLPQSSLSHLSFVTAQVLPSSGYPLELCVYKDSKLFCDTNFGTLKLQESWTEPCSCYVMCIVMCKEASSHPLDAPSLSLQRPLAVRYHYAVFYQLMCPGTEIDLRHWKVHIIPFKDVLGFHVRCDSIITFYLQIFKS